MGDSLANTFTNLPYLHIPKVFAFNLIKIVDNRFDFKVSYTPCKRSIIKNAFLFVFHSSVFVNYYSTVLVCF